jgi:hypothetical protein
MYVATYIAVWKCYCAYKFCACTSLSVCECCPDCGHQYAYVPDYVWCVCVTHYEIKKLYIGTHVLFIVKICELGRTWMQTCGWSWEVYTNCEDGKWLHLCVVAFSQHAIEIGALQKATQLTPCWMPISSSLWHNGSRNLICCTVCPGNLILIG